MSSSTTDHNQPATGTAPALDRATFRKKLWIKVMANPLSLLLMVGGLTDLLALWTFSIQSGVGVFAGVAGILGAVGVMLSRLAVKGETLGREVFEEMEVEAEKAREAALDSLDRKLTADGDPRTENSLRDLRRLAEAFHQSELWSSAMKTKVSLELLYGVDQLFQQCVRSLEKTLDLWYTASHMTTPDARTPILGERNRIIQDVGVSIEKLGRILADVQTLEHGGSGQDSKLAQIRRELDQNLQIAARVQHRMNVLDKELKGELNDV